MTKQATYQIRQATVRLARALQAQRDAIIAAHEAGASTREIAKAAGISHTQVRRVLAAKEH